MQPMKTLAAQFLAMSERSPALEMREDFSDEFIAELYNVPVESIITTRELESPLPSPTAVWHDSFIPVRIIGDMAVEFRALCVTAARLMELTTKDPVGKWWIELTRHFPTNASIRNESRGGTITNAAFWSSRLCELLSNPMGEADWSGYHMPGEWLGPFKMSASRWREAVQNEWGPSGFAQRDPRAPERGAVSFKKSFLKQRGVEEPE